MVPKQHGTPQLQRRTTADEVAKSIEIVNPDGGETTSDHVEMLDGHVGQARREPEHSEVGSGRDGARIDAQLEERFAGPIKPS